jgi:hypothetical protein
MHSSLPSIRSDPLGWSEYLDDSAEVWWPHYDPFRKQKYMSAVSFVLEFWSTALTSKYFCVIDITKALILSRAPSMQYNDLTLDNIVPNADITAKHRWLLKSPHLCRWYLHEYIFFNFYSRRFLIWVGILATLTPCHPVHPFILSPFFLQYSPTYPAQRFQTLHPPCFFPPVTP